MMGQAHQPAPRYSDFLPCSPVQAHCSIQLPLLMIPSKMNTQTDVFAEEPAPHIPAKVGHWSGEIDPPSRTVPDSPVRSETACV